MTAPGAQPASAIVLLVPELEPLVGEWRARYDPSAAQGVGAHMTLLFPFKPPARITDDDLATLTAAFAVERLPPLEFGGVCAFRNLVYLPPQPSSAVSELIAKLAVRYPECPPYGGSIPVEGIVPHVTVAYRESPEEQAVISAEFCSACTGRLPVVAVVRTARLIVQDDAGVYRTRAEFAFGG